jgi:hypothetical protein
MWSRLKKFFGILDVESAIELEVDTEYGPDIYDVTQVVRRVKNNPNLTDSGHVKIRGYTFVLDGCMEWSACHIYGKGFHYKEHSRWGDFGWDKIPEKDRIAIWKIIKTHGG